MSRDLEYENANIGYDYQYTREDGGGIKCKNYLLCRALLPKWWFDCKENYLCTNCHILFGTWGNANAGNTGKGVLEIRENIECPVCCETTQGISQPKCDHFVCIDCFKRCYYGEEIEQPPFPYPEIEEEYDDYPNNPKWKTEYPLHRPKRKMRQKHIKK